ncbi:hypothetical protein AX17_004931, partial [Amanita inopinata Kibby_2008]
DCDCHREQDDHKKSTRMSEKGPTVSANKLAMSRALGAAFLNHQVEQLEKTVARSGTGSGFGMGASAASGNWRERKPASSAYCGKATGHGNVSGAGAGAGVGGDAHVGGYYRGTAPRSTAPTSAAATGYNSKAFAAAVVAPKGRQHVPANKDKDRDGSVARRRSSDEEREREGGGKDADVVVVDASVLVHALYQVKRWCREGREEFIVVPLEALNTLDLLKKGTTSLAQRARAASRILEAQVGTNPRIQVQRDEAFVYWDKINFSDNNNAEQSQQPSPEWVRRTVCCARWEAENPNVTLGTANGTNSDKAPRVVLAVLSSPSSPSQSYSPPSKPIKLSTLDQDYPPLGSTPSSSPPSNTITTSTPVVPLPAPHGNKFEPRSSGTLVSHWAAKAGIDILEIEAALPNRGAGVSASAMDEEDGRPGKRGGHNHNHNHAHGHGHGHGHGKRKGSIGGGIGGGIGSGGGANAPGVGANAGGTINSGMGTGLVERPPAVMAMMEMVSQPSKVVRVLARGEKLDP